MAAVPPVHIATPHDPSHTIQPRRPVCPIIPVPREDREDCVRVQRLHLQGGQDRIGCALMIQTNTLELTFVFEFSIVLLRDTLKSAIL